MMKLIVLFCLIASTLAQQINVKDSTGINNKFLDVNTCDSSTKDGRFITALNSALTQWKVESKQEFCKLQCIKDQCGDFLTDESAQNNGQFHPLGTAQDFGRDQFQEGQLDQLQDSQQGQFQNNQQDGQFKPAGISAQQGQLQQQGSAQQGQFQPQGSAQQGQFQQQGSAQQGQFQPQGSAQQGQFQQQGSAQQGQFQPQGSAQQGQFQQQGSAQQGQFQPQGSAQQGLLQQQGTAQQGQFQPMVRNKRQAVNINNSVISDSTFISVNVCKMPKFQDLLKPINKFIVNMKKTDFKDLCRLHKTINICNCYIPPTTTPYYYKAPTTTYKSYPRSY